MRLYHPQANYEFLSRRCPMNDGCFTSRQIISYKGWLETHKSTPAIKRCNLFRGVCLILGAFVEMAGEAGSYRICEIVPVKIGAQKQIPTSLKLNNPNLTICQGTPHKFLIDTQLMRQKKNGEKKSL